MKKNRSFSAKQLIFMTFLLFLFTCGTLLLFARNTDTKKFRSITYAIFNRELTGNTLNLHYTLANPEKFGIHADTPSFAFYEPGSASDDGEREAFDELLAELRQINPSKFSPADSYTYRLLIRTLENRQALCGFPYYDEPLSPSSGVQSQLPILLSEYTFRSEKDVEDYLCLLGQTGAYFDSLLIYEREKKDAGLFMAASSADKVIAQCESILTLPELMTGTHFLQTTFTSRLKALSASVSITASQLADYQTRNDQLLKNSVLPAFQSLAKGLRDLKDDSVSIRGLSAFPNGAAYYQAFLTRITGSYRDVSEIRRMLLSVFSTEWNYLRELSSQFPEIARNFVDGDSPAFPSMNQEQMLDDLKKRIFSDFPPIIDTSVTIKDVDTNMEKYSAPAFYLTPPVDDYDDNVIYVNPFFSLNALEQYTTLAHEGFPGHLYQTVYYDRILEAADENILRSILWYGGYLEGWAMYAEFYGYDQAALIQRENGDPAAAAYILFEKHNRSLQICLYCLLDIMIHYENASVSDVGTVLSAFGIDSDASISAVYSYIAEEPCNYLKYYLGYLELVNLKERAKELWGDSYSDYRFHQFYLGCGPSDFTTLTEKLLQEDF